MAPARLVALAAVLVGSCLATATAGPAVANPSRARAPLARRTTIALTAPGVAAPVALRSGYPTSGPLRILLVPISWPGATQIQTASRLEAMLAEASAYYAAVSQGRLEISGDVAAPVALQRVAYAGRGLADGDVTDALAQSGVDLASYDRVVYAYPHIPDADWNGQAAASLAEAGDWVDLNGDEPASQLEHELGHTLGLEHAHALVCRGGILTSRCSVDEYGDATDLMGSGSNASGSTFDAIERYQLGWLSHVGAVTRSGAFALGALDAPDESASPRALVLETPRGELWVERAPARGTFFVHLADPSDSDWGSRLLEHAGNAGVFSQGSPFRAAGVTIRPLAAAGGILTLRITVGERDQE
ncbi:MAG TPA: hypothetical protein VGF46_00805 [Gaiellales bacterium]|jgi:hypothetical protein